MAVESMLPDVPAIRDPSDGKAYLWEGSAGVPNVATVPAWSDAGGAILSAQVLARGNRLRGTLDLRGKKGAFVFVRLGRGGTTALSAPLDILGRRMINGGAVVHPGVAATFYGATAAAVSPTIAADAAAGDLAITVSSATSLAVGDFICIQDFDGGVTRLEFCRIAKIASTVLTLDSPLKYAHTLAQADTVRNKADCFAPTWFEGGCVWELIVDYSSQSTGESVTVEVLYQRQDN